MAASSLQEKTFAAGFSRYGRIDSGRGAHYPGLTL
jgi:hypothetical protein